MPKRKQTPVKQEEGGGEGNSEPTAGKSKRARVDDSPRPDAAWTGMLYEIVLYRAVHGDLKIKSKDEKHRRLYDWMLEQRKAFKEYQEDPADSALTEDQVKVMDFLHFPWNTRGEEHWARNFEYLKAFRAENGHTMVPRTYHEVPNLCHWVTDQRRQMKNLTMGKPTAMTKERQRLLDGIGFVWQVRNRTTWDVRFQELDEYRNRTGSTAVPQHYAENRALGKWVSARNRKNATIVVSDASLGCQTTRTIQALQEGPAFVPDS